MTNASNLRFGVDDVGNNLVIDMPRLASDPLNTGHTFFLCLVRKHGTGNYIANCINTVSRCLEMHVYRYTTFVVSFDTDDVESESICVRLTANRDEHLVRLKLYFFAVFFSC